MPGRTVSRRMIVGLLGSGVALAPAVGQGLTRGASAPSPEPQGDAGKELLAPLGVGDKIGRFAIDEIRPLAEGAVTVAVSGEDRRAFQLEIMARDASPLAPRAPGETSRFAIYV